MRVTSEIAAYTSSGDEAIERAISTWCVITAVDHITADQSNACVTSIAEESGTSRRQLPSHL